MKQRVINSIIGVLVVVCLIGLTGLENYIKTTYNIKGNIIRIKNNNIIIEDTRKQVWIWCDEPSAYTIGESVTLTMNTNHTDSVITDDIITKITIE